MNDGGADPTAWAAGMDNMSIASYCEDHFTAHACDAVAPIVDDTPTSLAEAKESPYWSKWEAALKDELKSLEARGVWKKCSVLPRGAKMLNAKVVYKQKRD